MRKHKFKAFLAFALATGTLGLTACGSSSGTTDEAAAPSNTPQPASLTATDTLSVTVTANSAPTLTYANASVPLNGSTMFVSRV